MGRKRVSEIAQTSSASGAAGKRRDHHRGGGRRSPIGGRCPIPERYGSGPRTGNRNRPGHISINSARVQTDGFRGVNMDESSGPQAVLTPEEREEIVRRIGTAV